MHSVSFNAYWDTVTSTIPGMQTNLRSYYCRRLFNQKPELILRVASLRNTGRSRQEWGRAIAKAKKRSVLPHRWIYVMRIQNLIYLAAKVGRSHIFNNPHSLSCCQKEYWEEFIRCLFPHICYIPLVKHPVPLFSNGKYRVKFILKDHSTFCPVISLDDETTWIRAQNVLLIILFNCLMCGMSWLVCYLWSVKFVISWST